MRAAVFVLSVITLSGCTDDQRDAPSPIGVLVAANAAKDRAMVAGDGAALAKFYTSDYRVIDNDGNVHDRRDQIAFMTKEVDLLDAESADVRVTLLAKNAAVVTGVVKGRYRQEGRKQKFAERFTSIWVSEDSQWRVRHEHSSTIADAR